MATRLPCFAPIRSKPSATEKKAIIATLKEIYPNLKLHLDVMAGAQKGDDYDQSALLLSRHPNVKVVITPISAARWA